MNLKKVLEAIKEELKKPIPEPRVPPKPVKKGKRKMAKKMSSDESAKKPSKKKSKKAEEKKARKKAKSDEETNGGDLVTLKQLAAEADISPQAARAKLRNADLKRPEGSRWGWAKGSKELAKVRDALGL